MIDIYCDDCIAGLRSWVKDKSVDCIVTSPPYNLGIDYGNYDDSISRQSYLSWIDNVAIVLKDVLADDGSFFINLGGKPSNPYLPFQVAEVLLEHFKLQNTIHWIKSVTVPVDKDGNERSFGHFKPINSKRYLNDCHEYILHLTKSGNVKLDRKAIGVPYQDKSNIERWGSTEGCDLRCRGNVWYIPYKTIQNRNKQRPHPAVFPVELPLRCFKLHGVDKIKMALDPFVGIGSSAIAAKQLGIDFIGYDVDPEYCAEARKNVELA